MTNFGEHYNAELSHQESEINKRTLWEMVGAFIVLTAVWGLAFGRFPTVNAIVFSVTYAISAGFFIASVILFFKADPSDERMKCFFVTGICIISAAMNLMFSYHMVLVYVFPLIVAVQYKEKNVLWLSYALEVFLLPVSMIVGFYYGICDLNLLLQGMGLGHLCQNWLGTCCCREIIPGHGICLNWQMDLRGSLFRRCRLWSL